ncbi:hypothetical protein BDZ94DRAFT_1259421 [Collybia nuda]|uniref:Uncharacterized protein n=1 Tax=Collybia nuda TaxID=64659 RepID=A0A9P5Y6S2_9AGAR|nr:hypothetical protein BDZ94DRAFT_1259421 [Collybia nuda]
MFLLSPQSLWYRPRFYLGSFLSFLSFFRTISDTCTIMAYQHLRMSDIPGVPTSSDFLTSFSTAVTSANSVDSYI